MLTWANLCYCGNLSLRETRGLNIIIILQPLVDYGEYENLPSATMD